MKQLAAITCVNYTEYVIGSLKSARFINIAGRIQCAF